MQLKLSNQIAVTNMTYEEYGQITERYTFTNPAFDEALKFGRSTWKTPKFIHLFSGGLDGLTLPVGALPWLQQNFNPVVVDQRQSAPVSIPFLGELRLYQNRVLKLAMQHDNGLIVMPTGAGKTVTALALAAELGQRCLILVKSKDLAKQWLDAIQQYTGLKAGLIGGGKDTEGAEFTIGLTQTLSKRDMTTLNYGLVIADECHNLPAQQAHGVVNGLNARYKYGLSATPQRRDGLEFMIHAALGDIVAEVEAHELEGKVLPVTVQTIRTSFVGSPDSWSEFLTCLVYDPARNSLIVQKAIAAMNKTAVIILCAQVAHCDILAGIADQQGADALVLHGQLSPAERTKRMAQAPHARLIIGTLSLLSEGIDLPHLGALVFASPVSAEVERDAPTATRLIQSIGRVRRPFAGKVRAYVLDIVDGHPFGLAAFNKRREIYKHQGFTDARVV